MDDTFVVLRRDQIDPFHQHFNDMKLSINFTMEMEENGCLPFLDTVVTWHQDRSLTTKVHRKNTNTDKYLDYRSHHPLAHKPAAAKTLLARADQLFVSPRPE